MRSCLKWGWLAILLLLGTAAHADDAQDCRLSKFATLDMHIDHDRILVPVVLNGHEKMLFVNTGSRLSFLSEATVAELGLSRQMMGIGWQYKLVSGTLINETAIVPSFSIGGMDGKNFHFGIVPNDEYGGGLAGSLGGDVLRHYDVELDFAGHKLNLFAREHCPGKVVYWTHEPYAAIQYHFAREGQMLIPIKIDNVSFNASINTAWPAAVQMNVGTAREMFGWHSDPPELHRIGGASTSYSFPFSLLSLGGASVKYPSVELLEDTQLSNQGVRVGLDALKPFRIYISNDDATIYLTARDAR